MTSYSKKLTKNCLFCHNEFSGYGDKLYCSRKCANIASAPARRRRKILLCEVCHKEISITQGALKFRKKIRFCSRECMALGMRENEKHVIKKCEFCGKEKDILIFRLKSRKHIFCSHKCASDFRREAPEYHKKGFWYENGYRVLYLPNNKSIKEHIKIMEDYIGRKLNENEIVHHKNHIKTDNRIENLTILTPSQHSSYHRNWEKKNGRHLFGGYHNN